RFLYIFLTCIPKRNLMTPRVYKNLHKEENILFGSLACQGLFFKFRWRLYVNKAFSIHRKSNKKSATVL
ncbi:hypothetical protein ABEX44_29925, partial [Priestia megaterium]